VTTDFDGFAYLWDVATGEQIAALQTEIPDESYTLAIIFTPDGSRIVTSGAPGDVRSVLVWDAGTGEQIAALPGHTDFIGGLALSPDGTRLISVSVDATARVWDMQTYEELYVLEHGGAGSRIAFSSDGAIAAIADEDENIMLIAIASAQRLATVEGHTLTIYAMTFTADSTRLLTTSGDGTIRVWAVP
jgi:WD40 repeat protein